MNCVVIMYPNRTPSVEERRSIVNHTCFCLSVSPNMSDHTGKQMLTKTQKNPVKNLLNRSRTYCLVNTNMSSEHPFKNMTPIKTYLVLHVAQRKVAATEPSVRPKKTILPRSPYSVLLSPRESLITIAPAGNTPWSTLISTFMKRTRKNRKLTTARLN